MSTGSPSPQQEALQLFAEVARELSQPDHDLKSALRKCQFACQILNWIPQRDWFQRELTGYPEDIPVPPHRHITGQLVWQLRGGALDAARRELEQQLIGPSTGRERDEVDDELDCRGTLDFLLMASKTGLRLPTGETADEWDERRRRSIALERVRSFSETMFTHVVSTLNQITFDFATQQYAFLRYGNVLGDIWQDYRRQVDSTLQGLGFTPHLEQIQVGLQSENPEGWRSAVYECRTVLEDLANRLWLDPRKTYPFIKAGDGKSLDVSQGKFANRLGAYLHQKGARGKGGKLAREEAQRLATSIRALTAVQGKAHEPVTREAARAVAITAYVLLSDLVVKTDMQPITEYSLVADEDD